MDNAFRQYIAEFIGTFTLVLIGTAVATLQGFGQHGPIGLVEISLAFGCTLAVLVLVIGPSSGCHVNPAVTIPMALSGRLPWNRVPGYVIAQLAGALAASGLLLFLMSGLPNYELAEHGLAANGNPSKMTIATLFGWELVLTALFLFTIFTATRRGSTPGFHAIAIGGFLLIAHLVGAQLGDASLNPARSFGPAMVQGGAALGILWVFIVAPLVGGIAGWRLYLLVYDESP